MFPNPSSSRLTISFSEAWKGIVRIDNLVGKKMIVHALNGEHSLQLDISTLSAGEYFATFTSDNGVITHKKFVKQ
jgi:hypothetical protein